MMVFDDSDPGIAGRRSPEDVDGLIRASIRHEDDLERGPFLRHQTPRAAFDDPRLVVGGDDDAHEHFIDRIVESTADTEIAPECPLDAPPDHGPEDERDCGDEDDDPTEDLQCKHL